MRCGVRWVFVISALPLLLVGIYVLVGLNEVTAGVEYIVLSFFYAASM